MSSIGTHRQILSTFKRQRDFPVGIRSSQSVNGVPDNLVVVAAIRSQTSIISGEVGGVATDIMLDSGSSVSLMTTTVARMAKTRPTDSSNVSIQLVICGRSYGSNNDWQSDDRETIVSFGKQQQEQKQKQCLVAAIEISPADISIDDFAIPRFKGPIKYNLPEDQSDGYDDIITKYKKLFTSTPGQTSTTCHYIPTISTPSKIPPRRIPAHYREEVETQIQEMLDLGVIEVSNSPWMAPKKIQEMLDLGVIEVSNSPWMAPAVYVRKNSGDLRICVDYRELNKKTTKDAYPLPLADEVQDRLANSAVFTTLDLQSGYWQLPVRKTDRPKTAFCPGPGMGLYQLPFGLTGAPSSFQRLMDKVMRGLPFVSTYLDDVLIYSLDYKTHRIHLEQVFQRLLKAGLTLRGRERSKVSYWDVPSLVFGTHVLK